MKRLTRACVWLGLLVALSIPGVLRSAQVVRVGFYENSPKLFRDAKGEIKGFFPELFEYIANAEGWLVRYVPGSWDECLARLERGEIDVMPDVAPTEERSRRYLFNDVIVFNNWGIVYARPGLVMEKLQDMAGKRIAVMANSVHDTGSDGIRNLVRRFGIKNVHFVPVTDYHAVFKALAAGEVDIGVVNRIFGNLYQRQYRVVRTTIIFNPVPLKFAFPHNAERSQQLMAGIDRQLQRLKVDYSSVYHILVSKYFLETLSLAGKDYHETIQYRALLSNEERAWIQTNPVIRIGIDPGFVPFEFRDDAGAVRGIAHDYIALINRRFGLNMEVVGKLPWTEVVRRAKNREIDVLPCVGITAERQQYMDYSQAYVNFYRVIITRDDSPPIFGMEDLARMKVGVQAASSHHGYLKEKTNVKPVLYETFEQVLGALARGEVDVCIGNVTVAVYLIRKLGLAQLRIAAPVSSTIHTLHFAVRKDWPLLLSIINKGLSTVSYYEQESIRNRWINVEVGPVRGWWKYVRIAIILLVSLVLVVGMVMFWNRTMAHEIRRRKKIEGRLRESELKKSRMIEELDQLNRQKNEYIGIVAHDLRNPICAIELMASFLLENNRSKLDADQREFATRIEKLSHFMEMLIEDILDYSKIEAGKIELQKVRTDYNSLVLDNLRINSLIAEQKGININSDLEPGLSNIELDQKKIEQVLHNLLSNAVKYSGRDSRITVTTRKDGSGVMTVVRDQGQGIPEAELHQLFQPFQRTSVRATSGEASTGLGLAIVKRIVEAHGGSIGVRSRVGEGSEFYFYLPG